MLTAGQIKEYNEVGAIVVPNVLSADEVARAERGDRWVRGAGERADRSYRHL